MFTPAQKTHKRGLLLAKITGTMTGQNMLFVHYFTNVHGEKYLIQWTSLQHRGIMTIFIITIVHSKLDGYKLLWHRENKINLKPTTLASSWNVWTTSFWQKPWSCICMWREYAHPYCSVHSTMPQTSQVNLRVYSSSRWGRDIWLALGLPLCRVTLGVVWITHVSAQTRSTIIVINDTVTFRWCIFGHINFFYIYWPSIYIITRLVTSTFH